MTHDEQPDEDTRAIREMIATINRDYRAQLDPWFRRLAEIEARRMSPPLVAWAERLSKQAAP